MFAEKFQEDSEKKYTDKIPKYGESWKTCPIHQLRLRLLSEIDEWQEVMFRDARGEGKYDASSEYEELMDIRNMCAMIAERIRPLDPVDNRL